MARSPRYVAPPEDADALAAWLRALLTRAREPSAAERDVVVGLGQAAVPGLLAVLTDEDLSMEDSPGDGLAPVRAARLLGALRAEEAIRPLLALLLTCDPMEMLYSATIRALQRMGEAVVEPVLAALPAGTLQQRIALCEVLGEVGVRDPRILAALTALLSQDTEMGASFLATYRDPAALPLLQDAFDRHELRRAEMDMYGDRPFIELTEAIKLLGGTFTESQLRKIRRADLWLDEHRRELLARPEVDRAGPARPGRNDPCWCGSDRKYKKCHLASDAESLANED